MAAKSQTLAEVIEPAVTAMGYEWVGCEYHGQGKHTLLRIYIDSPAGISADDCAKVSRQVSAVLDVADPISGAYILEVSSPGMDRPIFTMEQMRHFIGQLIQIRMRIAQQGRRNFTGRLVDVSDDNVVLELDAGRVLLPFPEIDKANLVPEW